jgi:hypothetical protein
MHIPSQDTFGAEPVHNKEPKEDCVLAKRSISKAI